MKHHLAFYRFKDFEGLLSFFLAITTSENNEELQKLLNLEESTGFTDKDSKLTLVEAKEYLEKVTRGYFGKVHEVKKRRSLKKRKDYKEAMEMPFGIDLIVEASKNKITKIIDDNANFDTNNRFAYKGSDDRFQDISSKFDIKKEPEKYFRDLLDQLSKIKEERENRLEEIIKLQEKENINKKEKEPKGFFSKIYNMFTISSSQEQEDSHNESEDLELERRLVKDDIKRLNTYLAEGKRLNYDTYKESFMKYKQKHEQKETKKLEGAEKEERPLKSEDRPQEVLDDKILPTVDENTEKEPEGPTI